MITKLNLNKRRISLSLLTLIVFITNFNLLHSMDNEAERRLEKLPLSVYFTEFKNLVAEELNEISAMEFIYENRKIAEELEPLLHVLLQRKDPSGRPLTGFRAIPGQVIIRVPVPDRYTVDRLRSSVTKVIKGANLQMQAKNSSSRKRPNPYKHIKLDEEDHWIIPELHPYRIKKDVSYHQKVNSTANGTKLLNILSRGGMDSEGRKLQDRFIKRLVSSTLFETVNVIQEPLYDFLTRTCNHASFTLFGRTSDGFTVMPLGNLFGFSYQLLNFNGGLASNRRIYDSLGSKLPSKMTPLCITEAKISEIAEVKRPEEERRKEQKLAEKEQKRAKKASTMGKVYNAARSMLGLRRVETRRQLKRRNFRMAKRWWDESTKDLKRNGEALQIVANDYVNSFVNQTNKDSLFLNFLNVLRKMQWQQARGQLVGRIYGDQEVRMRFAQLNPEQFIEHSKNILRVIAMTPNQSPQGFAHSFLKISLKTSVHKAYNLAKRYKELINSVYCDANKFRCLNRKFRDLLTTYDNLDIPADLTLTPVQQVVERGLMSIGITHKDFLQHHGLRLPGSKQELSSMKPKITNDQYEKFAKYTSKVLEQCWEKSIPDSLKNTLNLFNMDNTTSEQSSEERRGSHEEDELKAKMSNFYKVALNWAFSLDTLERKYFEPDLRTQVFNDERVENQEDNLRADASGSSSSSTSSSSSSRRRS